MPHHSHTYRNAITELGDLIYEDYLLTDQTSSQDRFSIEVDLDCYLQHGVFVTSWRSKIENFNQAFIFLGCL